MDALQYEKYTVSLLSQGPRHSKTALAVTDDDEAYGTLVTSTIRLLDWFHSVDTH